MSNCAEWTAVTLKILTGLPRFQRIVSTMRYELHRSTGSGIAPLSLVEGRRLMHDNILSLDGYSQPDYKPKQTASAPLRRNSLS